MKKPRKRRYRTWHARPSAAARRAILDAVNAFFASPAGAEAIAGYAFTLRQLLPLTTLAPTTLGLYLRALVASGDLARVAPGVFALPARGHID